MNIFKYILKNNSNRYMENKDIDIKKLKESAKQGATILDVRSPQEYNEGHIDGAISMPEYELEKRAIKELNKEDTIVVYCSSGNRSKKAAKYLERNGFKKIYNLYNGIQNY